MVNSCLCKITHGEIPGLSFHSIPANENRKKQWSIVTNKHMSKTSRICSRYFLPNDFQYKVVDQNKIIKCLSANAVPSLLINQINDRINVSGDVTETNNCEAIHIISVAPQAHGETNQVTSSAKQNDEWTLSSGSGLQMNEVLNNDQELDVSLTKRLDKSNKSDEFTHESSPNLHESSCNNVCNEIMSIESSKKRTSTVARLSGSDTVRFKKKRYVGDLGPEDFTNVEAYEIVKKLYDDYRQKNKAYSQTICRLKSKLTTFKDLIEHLQEAGFETKGFDALKVSLD